jgi:hypothetical protein
MIPQSEQYNEKTVLFAFRLCAYYLIREAKVTECIRQLNKLGEITLKDFVDFFVNDIVSQLPNRITPSTGRLANDESQGNSLMENSESVYIDSSGNRKCNVTAECVAFINKVISFVNTDQTKDAALMQQFALNKILLFYLIEYKNNTRYFLSAAQITICGTCRGEFSNAVEVILFEQFTYHGKDIKRFSSDELTSKKKDMQSELYVMLDAVHRESIGKLAANAISNKNNENKSKIISLIIAVIIALLSAGACVVGGLLIGKIFNIGLNALANQIIQYGILAIGVVGLVVDAICNSNRIRKSINRIRKSIGGCLCCNIDEQPAVDLPETIHTELFQE